MLVTLVAVRLAGLSFNLMTLGGIAAAIGLVIDDAIVVVEAIHAKLDELLRVNGDAQNQLTKLDNEEPEQVEAYRDKARARD